MRLIDVEELKKCIKQVKEFLAENLLGIPMKQEVLETVETFIGLVESMPTVDAEPVRYGKWVRWDDYGHSDTYECTACKESIVILDGESPVSNGMKYCPYCGAKMDGGNQK